MKNDITAHSCIDCVVTNCNNEKTMYPDFCPTAELLRKMETDAAGEVAAASGNSSNDSGDTAAGNDNPTASNVSGVTIDDVLTLYIEDEENSRFMHAAAQVEYENYCKMTRIEEIAEFARKINAQTLGIATCVGLISEARTAAKFFRHKGFEVYGIACKVGAQPKTKLGIDIDCQVVGKNICNPIMQAKLLNEKKTNLNIVIGLCVGHDSLFYKYSDALCTTLVTKDRVLGHNPAAALYQMNSYYSKLMK